MLIHVVLLSGRSTTIDVAAGKYLSVSSPVKWFTGWDW